MPVTLSLLMQLCIALVTSPCCRFAQSEKINSSQLVHDSAHHFSCQIVTKCPTWFFFNFKTCNCQCLPYIKLVCDGNTPFVEIGTFVTYDENKELITITDWRWQHYQSLTNDVTLYNITKPGYIQLPSDINAINEYMCAPLNRTGFLCSECKSGFGPSASVMESHRECYICGETWSAVAFYLCLEFVPITLFFAIILVFHISVTSAPMTCFIMYCQLIIIGCYHTWPDDRHLGHVVFTDTGKLHPVSKICLTLYGVLNLDFFRHYIPLFCISNHLQLIHVAFLGYISALYPMVLVVLTWICINLHARNCSVIVYLWKPFHPCFVRLSRSWDAKNDVANAFASLFLLSFSKILYQAGLLLFTRSMFYRSLSGDPEEESRFYILSSDPNIIVGSQTYYTIVFTVVLITVLFSFLPVLVLTLYPFRVFRTLLSKCRLDCITLTIFVEKFHGCFRDGVTSHGRDMRALSGLYFFVRIVVLLVDAPTSLTLPILGFSVNIWLVRGAVFLLTALLIALYRPYKKTYMNVSDALLLSHLALLCHFVSAYDHGKDVGAVTVVLIQMVILTPFAIFLVLLSITATSQTCKVCFQKLRPHLKAWNRLMVSCGPCTEQQSLNPQPATVYGTMGNYVDKIA